MVKFVAGSDDNDKKLIALGFSFENLDRLRKGMTIAFSVGELLHSSLNFDKITANDEIFIFADETEENMLEKIKAGKWGTDDTIFIDNRDN